MKFKRVLFAVVSILSVVLTGSKLTAFDKAGVARNVSSSVLTDAGNHV